MGVEVIFNAKKLRELLAQNDASNLSAETVVETICSIKRFQSSESSHFLLYNWTVFHLTQDCLMKNIYMSISHKMRQLSMIAISFLGRRSLAKKFLYTHIEFA